MDNRHKPLHPSLVREAFAWIRKKANIGPTGGRRPTLHALRHYHVRIDRKVDRRL